MTTSRTMAASDGQNDHYGQRYFDMQADTSRYSAVIDRFKFETHIKPSDRVVDFGCGGGYMLAGLTAREKIGVEINETAAAAARRNGLKVVPDLDLVEDGWADVIISHHALEHVDDPLGIVRTMKAKLRSGGKVVIVTPDESYRMRYREDDPNFHLFTWSPSNLGNLLKRAGFADVSAAPVHHRWPPYWWIIGPLVGRRLMHALCVVHARVRTAISQVRAIGYKP